MRHEHCEPCKPGAMPMGYCHGCEGLGAGATAAPAGAALPCPFCGSAAKVFTREIHDTTPEPRRKLYWYVCNSPQCGVGLTRGEWSERRALEKWNTRKEEKAYGMES